MIVPNDDALSTLLKGVPIQRDAPLRDHTYVGLGGPARALIEPRHSSALRDSCGALYREGVPFSVLGGGANLMVSDKGVEDVVVSTRNAKGVFKEGESGERLRVDAGVSMPWLITKCRESGLSGLEPLVGIPGSVGGIVQMNAGGRFGDVSALVREVVILRPGGEVEALEVNASHFGYRESLLGDGVILEAVLQLERRSKDQIFEKMKEVLQYKRSTQPLHLKTTGCFFKNPEGHHASRLLDEAGLKGERLGRAVISEQHANFIVNEGGATSDEFLGLARRARDRVRQKFNVELVPEVHIWGESF